MNARKPTKSEREWMRRYKNLTMHPAHFVDELLSGEITFSEFIDKNYWWFEEWANEAQHGINKIPVGAENEVKW